LKRLAESIPGIEQVASHGDSLLEFQSHCPLLSLPQIFGTTLATIPAAVPYLKTDPQLVAQWRQRIGDESRLKVGIAWAGNASRRTIAIAQFRRSCSRS